MSGLNSVGERACRLPETSETETTGEVEKHGGATTSASPPGEADAEPTAGMCALLETQDRGRDLSHLFTDRAPPDAVECSEETGTSDIDEADTRYGGTSTNWVPNTANSSCNDGRSYCNGDEDIVAHTLEEQSRLLDQRGYLFDMRNVHPRVHEPEPQAAEETKEGGTTVSVGLSATVCGPEACLTLSAEVGQDDDGDTAVSVAAGGQVGANAPGLGLMPYVKVTNAADILDVASGAERNAGVDVGAGSFDFVEGEDHEGVMVGVGPNPVGVHAGVSYGRRLVGDEQ